MRARMVSTSLLFYQRTRPREKHRDATGGDQHNKDGRRQ